MNWYNGKLTQRITKINMTMCLSKWFLCFEKQKASVVATPNISHRTFIACGNTQCQSTQTGRVILNTPRGDGHHRDVWKTTWAKAAEHQEWCFDFEINTKKNRTLPGDLWMTTGIQCLILWLLWLYDSQKAAVFMALRSFLLRRFSQISRYIFHFFDVGNKHKGRSKR